MSVDELCNKLTTFTLAIQCVIQSRGSGYCWTWITINVDQGFKSYGLNPDQQIIEIIVN